MRGSSSIRGQGYARKRLGTSGQKFWEGSAALPVSPWPVLGLQRTLPQSSSPSSQVLNRTSSPTQASGTQRRPQSLGSRPGLRALTGLRAKAGFAIYLYSTLAQKTNHSQPQCLHMEMRKPVSLSFGLQTGSGFSLKFGIITFLLCAQE